MTLVVVAVVVVVIVFPVFWCVALFLVPILTYVLAYVKTYGNVGNAENVGNVGNVGNAEHAGNAKKGQRLNWPLTQNTPAVDCLKIDVNHSSFEFRFGHAEKVLKQPSHTACQIVRSCLFIMVLFLDGGSDGDFGSV